MERGLGKTGAAPRTETQQVARSQTSANRPTPPETEWGRPEREPARAGNMQKDGLSAATLPTQHDGGHLGTPKSLGF